MGTEEELSNRRGKHEMLICNEKEDIAEPVLECQTTEIVYTIKANTPNQWAEVVKVYRENKKLRKQ